MADERPEDMEPIGAYWSVTRYEDIMAWIPIIASRQSLRSSCPTGRFLCPCSLPWTSLTRRAAANCGAHCCVAKSVSDVADYPRANAICSRQRTDQQEFDWVDKVSIELTTMMLATLFDFLSRIVAS